MRQLNERNNAESRMIKVMLDDVLVSVQWGNWLIFLNDQNQARPVFRVLEVVFVQTGHDHCVITLIAHHTDHNLYCWSCSLVEMFLGPTLTIMNCWWHPGARNTEDTWWHVWQWDKYSAVLPVTRRDWLPLPQTILYPLPSPTACNIKHTQTPIYQPTYKKYWQNIDKNDWI